jgi:hypothetical protein
MTFCCNSFAASCCPAFFKARGAAPEQREHVSIRAEQLDAGLFQTHTRIAHLPFSFREQMPRAAICP